MLNSGCGCACDTNCYESTTVDRATTQDSDSATSVDAHSQMWANTIHAAVVVSKCLRSKLVVVGVAVAAVVAMRVVVAPWAMMAHRRANATPGAVLDSLQNSIVLVVGVGAVREMPTADCRRRVAMHRYTVVVVRVCVVVVRIVAGGVCVRPVRARGAILATRRRT